MLERWIKRLMNMVLNAASSTAVAIATRSITAIPIHRAWICPDCDCFVDRIEQFCSDSSMRDCPSCGGRGLFPVATWMLKKPVRTARVA